MDIVCANLRDRRQAASDTWRVRSSTGRMIDYSRRPRRQGTQIQAIILHQTGVNRSFTPSSPSPYPPNPQDDERVSSNHILDNIQAHFVIINDGTIFYTHDVDYLSPSAGGSTGIDIEFAGLFSLSNRLEVTAINSGRALITALTTTIRSIRYIHPHGQIQRELMGGRGPCGGDTGVRCGKIDSDPQNKPLHDSLVG